MNVTFSTLVNRIERCLVASEEWSPTHRIWKRPKIEEPASKALLPPVRQGMTLFKNEQAWEDFWFLNGRHLPPLKPTTELSRKGIITWICDSHRLIREPSLQNQTRKNQWWEFREAEIIAELVKNHMTEHPVELSASNDATLKHSIPSCRLFKHITRILLGRKSAKSTIQILQKLTRLYQTILKDLSAITERKSNSPP